MTNEVFSEFFTLPEDWEFESVDANGQGGFIIRTPRVDGARANTSVWADDDDPAHVLLYLILQLVQTRNPDQLPPKELLASRLIDVWCANNGQIPWDKAVKISGIITNMSRDAIETLLSLGK